MICDPSFWLEDATSIILKRNDGYLNENNCTKRRNEALTWARDLLGESFEEELKSVQLVKEVDQEEYQRIFILDAGRTFISDKRRERHVEVLATVFGITEDYHQGLGFIVAWLELFLKPSEVVAVVRRLNEGPMDGYFKAKAVKLFRDCKVVEKLLAEHDKELSDHLNNLGIVAATFASKWLVGLCLHVFHFKALAKFYEEFFKRSGKFLMCLALAMLKTHREKLLATSDVGKILAILRHEADEIPDDAKTECGDDLHCHVVETAVKLYEETDLVTMDKIEEYRHKAQQELDEQDRARQNVQDDSSDGIYFSDEISDE